MNKNIGIMFQKNSIRQISSLPLWFK